MANLVHVKGNTYYIDGNTRIGVVVNSKNECVIIDSGIDEGYGRKVLKALEEKGWSLKAIINTHSHADHCGGNAFLQKRTEALVYASSAEGAIMENPELEPYYLFSAAPIKELQVKFLQSVPSQNVIALNAGMNEIADLIFRIIPIPGHSLEQIGVLTTDGVFFAGDALFPHSVWEKYGLPYFENIGKALETLKLLQEMECEYFIISHYGAVEDVKKMAALNIQGIGDIINQIEGFLENPMTREELLEKMMLHYGVSQNIVQYFLTFSNVSAYLSYLSHKGRIEVFLEGGRLLWRRTVS